MLTSDQLGGEKVKKIYRTLTKDQLKRGVMFSSALSVDTTDKGANIHEVFVGQADQEEVIARLKNDSFFDRSPYRFNVIRS